MHQTGTKTETKSRLIARLLWPMIKAGEYTTLADLTDALKYRCAQLRISWTPDDISAAYRLIDSNTPLLKGNLK